MSEGVAHFGDRLRGTGDKGGWQKNKREREGVRDRERERESPTHKRMPFLADTFTAALHYA